MFETAFEQHSVRAGLMATRSRLKRYTYGDQWSDMVRDADGTFRRESEVMASRGRRPLTNNLIRRLVKTIVGRYRDMAANEGWYDTREGSTDVLCELDELDSRLLEEFLISGMAIQRVADDNPLGGCVPSVVNVVPTAFFSNDFRDPRGQDIEFVGMLHDMSPAEARLRFATNDRSAMKRLDDILGLRPVDFVAGLTGPSDFYVAARGRVRIIEIWTREYTATCAVAWRVRWFAANGALLATYLSPWRHRGHPFAVKFYPLTDGEVHSFVEDVVDQQRYINRLIVLIDRIMATSAKGVLLFPNEQKIQGMSWADIANRWAAADGIIPVTGRSGYEMPRQVSFSGGDANAHRLLELELKLFDEVSGVSSALLGNSKAVEGGVTGANLYNAQVENATIALADIFRTFRAMIKNRNEKLSTLR